MPTDMGEEPRLNHVVRRLVDRALSPMLGLPAPSCRYRVIRGLRVPVRDGAELVADLYAPVVAEPRGTILVRSPYGRGYPLPQFHAQPFAARGFSVLVQSVRGTYGSTGQFLPAVHETADAVDTVEWLRRQEWFTGRLATIGASYLGLTQWALLNEPPPELLAAVIVAGPNDYSGIWSHGTFAVDDSFGWSKGMSGDNLTAAGPIRSRLTGLVNRPSPEPETPMLPLGAVSRAALGTGAPWFDEWISHPDRDDPWWDPMRFDAALDQSQVPVLLINGWQDLHLDQTLDQYDRLHSRGVDVAMTIGPWTHARMLRKGVSTYLPEAFEWIRSRVAGEGPTGNRAPVRLFVQGQDWLELPDWPPTMPERVFYLAPDETLSDEAPAAMATPSSFNYDPSDPTPSVGGPLMRPTAGYQEDNALSERADVLTFTGAPLAADLFMVGHPLFELVHSADNAYTDVFVRISSVDEEGQSTNVADGYLGLPPTQNPSEPRPIRIEMDAVAHRFPAGSRIRVMVAGGAFPRFVPNHGTGEPVATSERLVTATHVVHHGAGGASRILLPAGDRLPGGPRT